MLSICFSFLMDIVYIAFCYFLSFRHNKKQTLKGSALFISE